MSDNKLLELAAKAAGIEGIYFSTFASDEAPLSDGQGPWNPLTDDGDALRLAVKLKVDLIRDFDRIDIVYGNGNEAVSEYLYDLPTPTDPYAATRRAIVRAAAEIGKGMK